MSFVLFFVVAVAIDVGLHSYVWTRLVWDPGWPLPVQRTLTALVIGLGVGIPLGMFAVRTWGGRFSEPIASSVFVWMGTLFILVMVLFAVDIFRWALIGGALAYAKLNGAGGPADPVRRELLSRGAALAATAATTSFTAAALRGGSTEAELKEVEVKLPRLPQALSGVKVVQLSDVHVGPLLKKRFVQSIVERTNAVSPDVVVITGDLVDGSVAELREHTEALSKLKARWGVYFTTGNHEYYSGVDEWLAELTRLGIRVLRNERVSIGDGGASFDLAGIDDAQAHRFGNGHGADLTRALKARDPERELLLLAHQPKAIDDAAAAKVGLQLSGHTHGGQIWPFEHAVRLVQPYVAGLHHHSPDTQIYVSRGTGFWGPPMRLMAPAEITQIVLTA